MTESEEMYLVTILRVEEAGQPSPVPLTRLAAELEIAPVSVNQMVRKLSEAGWLCYTPYKGVELTEAGRALGLEVLRHRRIWEVFLAEKLRLPVAQAEELACRLEHAIPPDAAERLAGFLGHPTANPRGLPIPQAGEVSSMAGEVALTSLEPGECGEVVRLIADNASRAFFHAETIQPGDSVQVTGLGGSGAILLRTSAGHSVHLTPALAQSVWVKKVSQQETACRL